MSGLPGLSPDRILSDRQEELRERAARIVEQLASTIKPIPAVAEDVELLQDAAERLRTLFLLVIVGEFNSGKSALINALLGATVMPEGVTPTTSAIHLLTWGSDPSETVDPGGIVRHLFPSPLLREVNLVDTPGTNAILREHETLSQRFVPRADLVIFVTSADRPFTESERQFMEEIRNWGKKIVIVLNKVDLLTSPDERAQVEAFVRTNAGRLLGLEPEMFAISARQARQAQTTSDPDERNRLQESSQFGAFERFVIDSLDEEERVRLKILNPLGVADRIAGRYRAVAAERLQVLERDAQTIERIEQRLETYRAEMRADFTGYLSRVEAIIYRLNERADRFFDDTIRLGRVIDLFNRDRVRAEFQEQVVADTERQIDETIADMIDWMVGRDLAIWQSVRDYIDRRELDRHSDEIVGEPVGTFHYDRQALLAAVGQRSKDVVQRYDPQQEGLAIAETIRSAVSQAALVEVGAVGLGAVVVALATTAAMDVTGILAAITIGGLGLLILPARKRRARALLRERSSELETRLRETLSDQFEREIERSIARVRDTVGPYSTFVLGERDNLRRLDDTLARIDEDIRETRRVVGQ
jgi:small GTP-binding protein